MSIRRNVMWITRTAVLTALLVTVQLATAPLGNQFVTGSAGNLIMVVALLTCGPATGVTVAIVSPACASLIGFGPAFPPLVPFIALGNAAFICAWHFLGKLNKFSKSGKLHRVTNYMVVIIAAFIKFLVLYAGIVKIAVPYILDLNEKQGAVLTLAFSYPQIITATIGGVIALAIVPTLRKALNSQSM